MPDEIVELAEELRSLRAIEKWLRTAKSEHLTVLQPNGTIILDREGESNRIRIGDLLSEVFTGNIVTHNHPNDDSFGRRDVQLLLTHKAAQMRVVTAEWTYILDLPENTEWDDVKDLVVVIQDQVLKIHQKCILSGEMTFEESKRLWWHDVWTGVSEVRGWHYRKQRNE